MVTFTLSGPNVNTPSSWLGVDLGGTNVRLYSVFPENGQARLLFERPLPPESEARICLVGELLGHGPESVALATAGLKDEDRMGVVKSNFAPVLPDLIPKLRRVTGRRIAPLQDDGWAAAVAERTFGILGPQGYYLGSGTGLAEAISQNGVLVEHLVKAYEIGREEALRACNWRARPDEQIVSLLKELVDWRQESYALDQVVLGQRFRHRPELGPALSEATRLKVQVSEFTASPAVGAVLLTLEGAESSLEKPPA